MPYMQDDRKEKVIRMIKQDWMVIVAGEALVDALTAETMALVPRNAGGYASESLVDLQRRRASNGIVGAEIVKSMYGHSVRYDSGLQNFGLLASSRAKQDLDGSLEAAEQWCRDWVARDPEHRYAWRRK
jgi:hypothetical protein